MVSFNKETYQDLISSKSLISGIEINDVNEILKNYPAFNNLYLVKASILENENKELFQNELPKIACFVKDRSVLHDIVFDKNKFQVETKTELVPEKEAVVENDLERIQATETKAEELLAQLQLKEQEEIERLQAEKIQEEIARKELEEEKKKEAKEIQEALELQKEREKEEERSRQLQEIELQAKKLQEDLEQQKKLETEKNRIIAEEKLIAEKLQEELKQKNELEGLLKLQETSALEGKEDRVEEMKIDAIRKLQKDLLEDKVQENPLNVETKLLDSSDVSNISIEEKVLEVKPKTEVEKVSETSVKSESKAKSENPNDFLAWLKQKKKIQAQSQKAIETKVLREETKKITTQTKIQFVEDKLKEEDEIPFERASVIEAEMHQEIKESVDPLESFISSQIIRKKKIKRKHQSHKETDNTDNTEIVSETLAEIYSLQQKYSEAIDVYKQLSLKYPQKSIYFANQIEKLNKYL